ncbi:MAG TPA: TonB-dependent receptor [Bryobacteraceae bacterium]|nr:TonB-dependent receptor [Bryobacteraceae bacterium]
MKVVVALFLTVSGLAWSQNASLEGVVTDPSSGVIISASVAAANRDTGLRQVVKTNGTGAYTFSSLPPGRYQITAEASGFRTAAQDNVVLEVGQSARLDFSMELGDSRQSVIVEGSQQVLQATDGSVSTVVDRRFVENLPLNGRSFQNLFQLTPGLVVATTSFYDQGQFNVNGQRADANYYTVDGVSANFGISAGPLGQSGGGALPALTAQGGFNGLASVDAVQEFRIQTSTFSPEYGRTPGAQISISTRSGTNQFHGTLFDYFRNDKLDADDWFANQQSKARPKERQNDFGGVMGGPIRKNKDFFFFSYEGLRLRQPQVIIDQVPDAALRAAAPSVLQPVLNAFSQANGPELGNGLAQFSASYSSPTTLNATSIRADHLTGKWTIFGRFNDAPSHSLTRAGSPQSPNDLTHTQFDTLTATAGATWLASPTVNNDLRFNFSRSHGASYFTLDNFGGAGSLDDSLVFPSFSTPQTGAFVFLCCGNLAELFEGANAINRQLQFNTVDTLSYVKGKHQLKFGIDQRHLMPTMGRRSYDTEYLYSTAAAVIANTPAPVYVDGASGAAGLGLSTNNYSVVAQDTWRAGLRLTVTYGLRWEYDPAPGVTNRPAAWTPDQASNLATMQLAPDGSPLWHASGKNFAPRLGIAYQLSSRPNWATVVRTGGGIFYDIGYGQLGDVYAVNSQYYGTTIYSSGATFPLTTAQATPPSLAGRTPPIAQVAFYDPKLRLPYTIQWNFSAEQQLGVAQTLTVSYVGAAGHRLLREDRYSNPSPNFTTVYLTHNVADSNYHALQTQFRRTLSRGLQALGSYTWAHSIDNASSDSYTGTLAVGRAASNFDVRQTFTAALSYDIPKPRWNNFSRAVLGGWSVDSMNMVRTAEPLTVIGSSAFIDGVYVSSLPNLVPGQPFYLHDATVAADKRINAAAFQAAATGQTGNEPRNFLRGFGAWQSDLAIRRQFTVRERWSLQLRGEFFNIFNHPNFAQPTNLLTSPLFGISTSMLGRSLGSGGLNGGFAPIYQIGGPRSVQLAMKFLF